ncbi:MAG: hypothetical protein R3C16_02395 [Hyphomonadaceae bacterium]
MAAALAACQPAPPAPATDEAEPAAGADVDPSYVGVWARDASSCDVLQEMENAPMIVTADGYDQHEAHCSFTNVTERAPNAWHIEAQCMVEGDEQETTLDWSVDGDTLTLAPDFAYVRCPAEPPKP